MLVHFYAGFVQKNQKFENRRKLMKINERFPFFFYSFVNEVFYNFSLFIRDLIFGDRKVFHATLR